MAFPFCEWVVLSLCIWGVTIVAGLVFLVFGIGLPRRK
jgi:hypothetical protein